MTIELAAVLGLLAAAIVMFAIDRPRMDAVALIVMTVLPLMGVITMSEALAGFSDANIVLIAALFVIGDGLVRTGVARQLGDWLTVKAGSSESRLIVLLMLVVCGLGATMSSTAVTAIFIPVVLRIARRTGIAPSRLLMPLSMAALISGMTTLVATAPNLVVNSELVRAGAEGFQFFSFTPFGLPILALGIVYMLVARRWLPDTATGASTSMPDRPSLETWVKKYQLAAREHRVRISQRSPLVGQTLQDIRLRDESGAHLIAVQRGRALLEPTELLEFQAGDILLVDLFAPDPDVSQLIEQYALEPLPLTGGYFTDRSQEIGMVEVIVPADSKFVGQTVAGARIRDQLGLNVIGLRRGVRALEEALDAEELRIGDTLLLTGSWRAIQNVQAGGRDLVPLSLPAEHEDVLAVAGKALPAVCCLALVVGLMVSGIVPNVQAALIGCLLMGALGVVNLESAYRSIDWKTIVLIVGMLPFSTALQRTGGVYLASDALMTATGGAGVSAILATLFVLTAVLGMFISNTATAVLMAPVALAVADELQVSPYPFAMIVALAASTAFMTPVSSPVNTLVVTPGGYRFGDFVKIGVPFSLIVLIVSVLIVPVLLPP
ncbi:MAG: SLC13 family permease [Planctomycetaceae bacterium]|nr:SLC13 family permease [Planctomycetaceae bacterium]